MKKLERIEKEMNNIFDAYLPHPFLEMDADNIKVASQRFFAGSILFPYVQAGSQSELLKKFIDERTVPTESEEITSVVGNFLSWDETGGHFEILKHGVAGLNNILKTESNFHSNLLRKDLISIFGEGVEPDFDVTADYMKGLYDELASLDSVTRCASMVSFERHANLVLDVWWNKLADIFATEKRNLNFFDLHVGSHDDSLEKYHVAMTNQMIDKVVKSDQVDYFIQKFEASYSKHILWCRNMVHA